MEPRTRLLRQGLLLGGFLGCILLLLLNLDGRVTSTVDGIAHAFDLAVEHEGDDQRAPISNASPFFTVTAVRGMFDALR